jgi:hypothetical protein
LGDADIVTDINVATTGAEIVVLADVTMFADADVGVFVRGSG